jgi:16S rRNA (cytosine967-C5)-methyltransferase
MPDWAWDYINSPVDTAELVQWLQERPPLWLRVQKGLPAKVIAALKKEELEVKQHPTLPNALYLQRARVNLYTLKPFRDGAFEVQDLASQLIGHVCQPQPGERWWDACAGAGGKSLHLAALMQEKGTVVATDIRGYKLADLKKRARRAGIPNITCKPWDGKRLRPRQATFDGVLVDAPCTCSGTWRRNPDARWSTRLADVEELAEVQRNLLHAAASGLKPRGVLVYATCSMFRRENEDVVASFLADHSEFALEPFPSPLSGHETNGMLQTWPWDGDCDAMFVARLRHTG